MQNGVSVYGAYSGVDWSRSFANITTVLRTSSAQNMFTVQAQNISASTVLDAVRIVTDNNATSSGNAYGVCVTGSNNNLVLSNLTIEAGNGGNGQNGNTGGNGSGGGNGGGGQSGCDGCSGNGNGGGGGSSACNSGGNGGRGGYDRGTNGSGGQTQQVPAGAAAVAVKAPVDATPDFAPAVAMADGIPEPQAVSEAQAETAVMVEPAKVVAVPVR